MKLFCCVMPILWLLIRSNIGSCMHVSEDALSTTCAAFPPTDSFLSAVEVKALFESFPGLTNLREQLFLGRIHDAFNNPNSLLPALLKPFFYQVLLPVVVAEKQTFKIETDEFTTLYLSSLSCFTDIVGKKELKTCVDYVDTFAQYYFSAFIEASSPDCRALMLDIMIACVSCRLALRQDVMQKPVENFSFRMAIASLFSYRPDDVKHLISAIDPAFDEFHKVNFAALPHVHSNGLLLLASLRKLPKLEASAVASSPLLIAFNKVVYDMQDILRNNCAMPDLLEPFLLKGLVEFFKINPEGLLSEAKAPLCAFYLSTLDAAMDIIKAVQDHKDYIQLLEAVDTFIFCLLDTFTSTNNEDFPVQLYPAVISCLKERHSLRLTLQTFLSMPSDALFEAAILDCVGKLSGTPFDLKVVANPIP